ncbi:MAG: peptidyl-prolyl cis-trans isomerase [candidate division NC10 bacterium]|nr:peptidyl-prolyl cis-trans isomerase [candidate division NC10 bacterium]
MAEVAERTADTEPQEGRLDEGSRTEVRSTGRGRRRWVVAGVVLLLALATGLALRSSWWRGRHADRNILAAYRGGLITKEALLERWRRAPEVERAAMRTAEGIGLTIQSLAVHAVMERWARERKLDAREMFTRAMREATQEIGIHDVEQRLHESDIRVEEGEIQQYFEANRDTFKDRSLSQVREEIRGLLHARKEEAGVQAFLKRLRDAATVTTDLELLRVPEPSREDIVAHYLANRDRFVEPDRVRIQEIQVDATADAEEARARAERARARLQAGEDLETVAPAVGGWASGGEDFVPRGRRGPAFDTAVLPLNEGELSPVFKEGNSFFVARLLERRRERRKALEEVEEEIRSLLRTERERQRFAEYKPRTLVVVNGQRYTLGDFLSEAESIPPQHQHHFEGFEGRRKLLDQLIERLLLLQSASGSMADLRNKEDIAETRRHLLAEMLHQEEMATEKEPTEEELKQYFQANQSRYQPSPRLKISLIEVRRGETEEAERQARAKAEAALKRARPPRLLFWRRGEDFAAVAREISEDRETAQKGGEVDGWFTHPAALLMDLESHTVYAQILSLRTGEVSEVMPLRDRYYLVKVRERQEVPPLPFDRVKEAVRADVRQERHKAVLVRMEKELLQRMDLVVHEDRVKDLLAELSRGESGTIRAVPRDVPKGPEHSTGH